MLHLSLFGVGGGLVLIVLGLLLHKKSMQGDFMRPGLFGITGPFGSGKGYLGACAAVKALEVGRPVFSSVSIRGGTLVSSWDEVVAVPDGSLVVLPEVDLWWNATEKEGPGDLEQWVKQLRHHGITVLWDSQHFSFVNTKFRKLTTGVWEASRQGRFHRYRLWWGTAYERRKGKPDSEVRLRRRADVMAAYDTHEDVVRHSDWSHQKGRKVAARSSLWSRAPGRRTASEKRRRTVAGPVRRDGHC